MTTWDLDENTAPTAPPTRVRPLPRDELPMPPQDGVRRGDRGQVAHAVPRESAGASGHTTTFLIRQLKPTARVRAQNAVLPDQVGEPTRKSNT